ncbi:hypothetical protein [Saccharospirillum salsuginis]|uniref:Uncharacterized protein n=1 Tax=Saccharospirillum salsuginis TaxID=418750 RepID=A0A918KJX0_9GAMM|nr:hypothetical protein [Saccharospirillum salsuginis]GGX66277.1 hypothetical protein GCM10007392_37420 [Saccharospirillum salsuginis]
MSTSTPHIIEHRTWLDRLIGRFYRANMGRTVSQFRVEAHTQYQSMITDLDVRLDPTFETLVADTLKRRELVDFRPSHVLFPRMMRQFEVTKSKFLNQELKTMSKQCDQCDHISQCWQALRRDADASECRAFCPNAEALIAKTQ